MSELWSRAGGKALAGSECARQSIEANRSEPNRRPTDGQRKLALGAHVAGGARIDVALVGAVAGERDRRRVGHSEVQGLHDNEPHFETFEGGSTT